MPGATNGTRVIALVGPAGAGKTSLAEAFLYASGTTDRQGSVANKSSIGDSSEEARSRGGSTETNLYNFSYLDEKYAIIDAPGSIGFCSDAARAIAVADVAIVVVDPDPARAALAAPALRTLDELGIPHLIFVNRIDQARGRIRDLLTALQPMSVSPLIARQLPIRDGEKVTGFVDIALERAYHYVPGKPSEPIALPEELADREAQARTQLLEQLADHDDTLLEQLLMDQVPEPGTIFADLRRETSDNLGVSVLFGSAQNGWGVRRLMKALRHEAPGPEATAARLGVDAPAVYAFKIFHGGSVGRLALARALGGPIHENSDFKSSGDEHGRLAIDKELFVARGKRVRLTIGDDGRDALGIDRLRQA